MKIKWICVAILYFGIPCYLISAEAPREIKLATQREGNLLSEKGQPYIKCAMGMINQPYKNIRVPWKRAQLGTEKGEYDGFFMASKNDKRDVYAIQSEVFVAIEWLYLTKKGTEISPNNENFNSRIFAADKGSNRLSWLEKQHKEGKIIKKIQVVNELEQLMKMLMGHRIDVALTNNFGYEQTLTKLSLDSNNFKTFVARTIPTAIYFSKEFLKKNPGFLKRFNASMRECKKQLK